MNSQQGLFKVLGGIDIRLFIVSGFLGFLTVWHLFQGTLFPDAIFFAVVTAVTLVLAFIGLGGEEGFEIGEGEGG